METAYKYVKTIPTKCPNFYTPKWSLSGKGWIVVHNTSSDKQDISTIINASAAGTGANFYIDTDGKIYEAHDLTKIIPHCGTSYAKGNPASNELLDKDIQEALYLLKGNAQNLNSFSVGIECVTSGFDKINFEQLQSLAFLCSHLQVIVPELKAGGITCHGYVMPNQFKRWGSKSDCGVLPYNQLKAAYPQLSYADIDQTPLTKKDATELLLARKEEEKKAKEDAIKAANHSADEVKRAEETSKNSLLAKSTIEDSSVAMSNDDFEEVFSNS